MYGNKPTSLGVFAVNQPEMMFYQYLPIKLAGSTEVEMEQRLRHFDQIIGTCLCDFVGTYGLNRFVDSYVYITAKKMFVTPGCSFNRPGWHSDGFMTEDINYIWSDCYGTIFNTTQFALTMDDSGSLVDMENQADNENDLTYPDGTLLRLDQFNIHRVADIDQARLRTFLKVSISKDKYDLEGNAHNYLLNYDWPMRKRESKRNIPQVLIQLDNQK